MKPASTAGVDDIDGVQGGGGAHGPTVRGKSFLTGKRILTFLGLAGVSFVLLEVVARVTGMTIFSPLLRLGRIEQYSISSIKTVLNNIQLIGHSCSEIIT